MYLLCSQDSIDATHNGQDNNDNDEYLNNKKELYNQNSTNCDQNAEHAFIAVDKSVWFIDSNIGIAFKTTIDFHNELNGPRTIR